MNYQLAVTDFHDRDGTIDMYCQSDINILMTI